jgi:hypothetical protein
MYAGPKDKKKKNKPQYMTGSGTVVSKTIIPGGYNWLDFKGPDDKTYTCMMNVTDDPRIRDYQQGDRVSVGGWKYSFETVYNRCSVTSWTSAHGSR